MDRRWKMKRLGDERAVSPVVGVMLMLVVTVILAAVVSSYAGGMAGTQKKAPQASFAVEIESTESTTHWPGKFVIKQLGGEPIVTKNIKLVTKWYNRTADRWEIAETVLAPFNSSATNCYIYDETGSTCEATTSYVELNTNYSTWGKRYKYHAPFLAVPGDMPADNNGEEEGLWFGNFVLQKGEVIEAIYNLLPPGNYTDPWGGTVTVYPDQKPVIANFTQLKPGDIVTVELIDLTTNTKIFSKDVVVQ